MSSRELASPTLKAFPWVSSCKAPKCWLERLYILDIKLDVHLLQGHMAREPGHLWAQTSQSQLGSSAGHSRHSHLISKGRSLGLSLYCGLGLVTFLSRPPAEKSTIPLILMGT